MNKTIKLVAIKTGFVGDRYNKTYYLVTDDKDGVANDELFTNKAKAIKEAKTHKKFDIMIFRGCKDDELAIYIGQLTKGGERVC